MFKMIRFVAGVGCILCLGGCTLAQMNRESDAMDQRIPVKEGILYSQSEERNERQAEQKRLQEQRLALQGQEDELDKTLESANQRLTQLKAANEQERRRQLERAARIRELKAESKSLRAQPDTDTAVQRKKLEALQKEADELLALPLGKEPAK